MNAIVVSEAFTPLYAKWIATFGDEEAQREQLDKITSRIPLAHRMTSVEEIANEAAFLAVRLLLAHHRPMGVRGRRLRPPRPRLA